MTTPYIGQPGGTGPYPLPGLPAPAPPAYPVELVATTGPSGVALQNGTPTFLTWTAPSDGQMHRVIVLAAIEVTALETGGAVGLGWTAPGGQTVAAAAQLFAAGLSAGPTQTFQLRAIESGSSVTVAQTTALTAGGPTTVWAEIWGS